jgi:amidase
VTSDIVVLPSAELAAAIGALRVGPAALQAGAGDGPLVGTVTVVKDLYAVRGQRTGAGNPDWLADAQPAEQSAPAVQAWVEAGATVVGLAHSDELAFSLSGTNVHYGTPRNPHDPERIPGGSSSGSVAAVAGGLVDYALATDTGGSTRVPASYCGVFGIRTSHGRVSTEDVVPLVPRFDAVGVLARDGATLERATRVLLGSGEAPAGAPTSIVLATDVLALADDDTAAAVRAAAEAYAAALDVPLTEIELAGAERLGEWRAAFMARQMPEIWRTHGEWVTRRSPSFGPGVASRMADARGADDSRMADADTVRDEILARLDELLPPGAVLAYATASGPAPRIDLDAASKGVLRGRTIAMTCIAGLGGLPAVSLPLGAVEGLPVGLCLVGRPGDDELLLAAARAADALPLPVPLPARVSAGSAGGDA